MFACRVLKTKTHLVVPVRLLANEVKEGVVVGEARARDGAIFFCCVYTLCGLSRLCGRLSLLLFFPAGTPMHYWPLLSK